MKKRILIGSIIAVVILLGVTFSSVVAVKDDDSVEYLGGLRGTVFVVGICKSISSNDTVVDITVGNGRLVIFLIGYKWLSHFEWIPHIGFIRVGAIEISNFKGITTNKFILGMGKVDGWFH
ncbi:unnamed protein product [marine sediment metagenome]|uniref:Uncharacterized protein n=1 Tax=marine sediment metagenome TaxID=412755 RepID=X0SUU4_9ZZZZ